VLSGVLAVVVAGLLLAHQAPAIESGAARLQTRAVWPLVDLLLEGFVFLLIGDQLKPVIDGLGTYEAGTITAAVGVTVAAVLVIRPLWLFLTRRLVEPRGAGASTRELIALSWSGTRGVITLVGQGLTLAPLLRALGLSEPRDDERCSTPSARSWCAGATAAASRIADSAHSSANSTMRKESSRSRLALERTVELRRLGSALTRRLLGRRLPPLPASNASGTALLGLRLPFLAGSLAIGGGLLGRLLLRCVCALAGSVEESVAYAADQLRDIVERTLNPAGWLLSPSTCRLRHTRAQILPGFRHRAPLNPFLFGYPREARCTWPPLGY
jgi:Sodium/hydrogen exchanger family